MFKSEPHTLSVIKKTRISDIKKSSLIYKNSIIFFNQKMIFWHHKIYFPISVQIKWRFFTCSLNPKKNRLTTARARFKSLCMISSFVTIKKYTFEILIHWKQFWSDISNWQCYKNHKAFDDFISLNFPRGGVSNLAPYLHLPR